MHTLDHKVRVIDEPGDGMRCSSCGEHILNCDAAVIPKAEIDDENGRRYHEDCAPEGWATSGAYYVVED